MKFTLRRPGTGRAYLRYIGLTGLLAGTSYLLALPAAVGKPVRAQAQAAAHAAANKPDPELLLIEVYKELSANHLRTALEKADRLVDAYPNFRLGHLIRGDLLLMHSRPVTTLGPADAPEDKLRNLREEAMVRLRSLRERPAPDMVPRQVLQLREDQRHVLLVDAKRSRLYVYEHRAGALRFVTDYYISQGKLGVNKFKEGDQKTPLGVYYITSHLAGSRLPDFYGSGALPINYPNEWDRLNGRSGSGIWLHGTPSDSYSRPPLSSDGCVVLTNPDLYKLTNSIEVGKTPVVISESIDFVNKAKWDSDRNIANRLVEGWKRDVESLNPARVATHYSRDFKSDRGDDVLTWYTKLQHPDGAVKNLSIRLRDTTHFFYPGRDDMIVSTFTQDSQMGGRRTSLRKRQYWAREGAQWKIIYEVNV